MRHALLTLTMLFFSTMILPSKQAIAGEPLKALILTSPGVYHNYEYQTHALAQGIVKHANVKFDVSLAELERWKTSDYSEGYDVLIYNICMADNTDAALIANMRRQTEQLGVPALFIHCTMHSFRETQWWWPLFGLKTNAHESMRPLPQDQEQVHPVLGGIPAQWTVGDDELYLNLEFDAEPLLSSVGEDGEPHVTAWLAYPGNVPVFGTTLGHSDETIKDPLFQRLIANALLFVTGSLSAADMPAANLEPDGQGLDIFDKFSAPQKTTFLGEEGQECAFRRLAVAAAPCFLGCIFNPVEWGDDTRACKKACETGLPTPDELIADCTPRT